MTTYSYNNAERTTTTVSMAETEYDSCGGSPLGKVKRTSLPYAPGGTVYWTVYSYDRLGRTLSVTTLRQHFPPRLQSLAFNQALNPWTCGVHSGREAAVRMGTLKCRRNEKVENKAIVRTTGLNSICCVMVSKAEL